MAEDMTKACKNSWSTNGAPMPKLLHFNRAGKMEGSNPAPLDPKDVKAQPATGKLNHIVISFSNGKSFR